MIGVSDEAVVVERGAQVRRPARPSCRSARRRRRPPRPGRPRCGPAARASRRCRPRRRRAARRSGRALVYSHRQRSRDHEQVGVGGLDRARGELDDALVVPGARSPPRPWRRGARTAARPGCRAPRPRRPPRPRPSMDRWSTPGMRRDRRARPSRPRPRTSGETRCARRELGLAHQAAQQAGPAQAAHAGGREHGLSLVRTLAPRALTRSAAAPARASAP